MNKCKYEKHTNLTNRQSMSVSFIAFNFTKHFKNYMKLDF